MEKPPVGKFAWMPQLMPRVAEMVKGKRREWGDAHVTECVARGLAGEPGWFFAHEGVVAVGVPEPAWTLPEWTAPYLGKAAMVWMREPGGSGG